MPSTRNLDQIQGLMRPWTLEKNLLPTLYETTVGLNYILKPYMKLSLLVREVFLYSKWKPLHKTTIVHSGEVNRSWEAHPQRIHILYNSCTLG